MNIWELAANDDYNDAFLIDESGKRIYENDSYFKELQSSSHIRDLEIRSRSNGFSDIMNYWGTNGSCIVSHKMKALTEKYFGDLSIQFFPCRSSRFPDVEMWILNVCEYHDVLDHEKSVCQKGENPKGEEIVIGIDNYAFTEKAFELDMFKIYVSDIQMHVRLYVSDRFKAIMEENEITGLALKKVYAV